MPPDGRAGDREIFFGDQPRPRPRQRGAAFGARRARRHIGRQRGETGELRPELGVERLDAAKFLLQQREPGLLARMVSRLLPHLGEQPFRPPRLAEPLQFVVEEVAQQPGIVRVRCAHAAGNQVAVARPVGAEHVREAGPRGARTDVVAPGKPAAQRQKLDVRQALVAQRGRVAGGQRVEAPGLEPLQRGRRPVGLAAVFLLRHAAVRRIAQFFAPVPLIADVVGADPVEAVPVRINQPPAVVELLGVEEPRRLAVHPGRTRRSVLRVRRDGRGRGRQRLRGAGAEGGVARRKAGRRQCGYAAGRRAPVELVAEPRADLARALADHPFNAGGVQREPQPVDMAVFPWESAALPRRRRQVRGRFVLRQPLPVETFAQLDEMTVPFVGRPLTEREVPIILVIEADGQRGHRPLGCSDAPLDLHGDLCGDLRACHQRRRVRERPLGGAAELQRVLAHCPVNRLRFPARHEAAGVRRGEIISQSGRQSATRQQHTQQKQFFHGGIVASAARQRKPAYARVCTQIATRGWARRGFTRPTPPPINTTFAERSFRRCCKIKQPDGCRVTTG